MMESRDRSLRRRRSRTVTGVLDFKLELCIGIP